MELLVVIAIIAILIAIVLPTLAAARRAGQRIACLSNMRQMGTTLTMWTFDHKGFLPKAWFNQYPDSTALYATPPTTPTGVRWGFEDPMLGWDYVLQRYIRNKNVFRCPADLEGPTRGLWTDTGYTNLTDKIDADNIPASYRLNLSNNFSPFAAMKLTQFRRPSDSIFICEGTAGPAPGNSFWHHVATWEDTGTGLPGHIDVNYKVNIAWDRHRRISNYVFVDGHADSLTWNQTWQPLGSPTVANTKPTRWRQRFEKSFSSMEYGWTPP